MIGRFDLSDVALDKLIGDVVQVIAHDLRLRADAQHIIAGTLDQRRLPSRCDGAQRIPGVAGDQTELGGLSAEFLLDIAVGLA